MFFLSGNHFCFLFVSIFYFVSLRPISITTDRYTTLHFPLNRISWISSTCARVWPQCEIDPSTNPLLRHSDHMRSFRKDCEYANTILHYYTASLRILENGYMDMCVSKQFTIWLVSASFPHSTSSARHWHVPDITLSTALCIKVPRKLQSYGKLASNDWWYRNFPNLHQRTSVPEILTIPWQIRSNAFPFFNNKATVL